MIWLEGNFWILERTFFWTMFLSKLVSLIIIIKLIWLVDFPLKYDRLLLWKHKFKYRNAEKWKLTKSWQNISSLIKYMFHGAQTFSGVSLPTPPKWILNLQQGNQMPLTHQTHIWNTYPNLSSIHFRIFELNLTWKSFEQRFLILSMCPFSPQSL